MPKYMITLTYLVSIEADSSDEAEKIAIQEIEDGKWNPNDIETEIWNYNF